MLLLEHVRIQGPITVRVCVDVGGTCYHQRPCGCACSGLLSEAMSMVKHCAELTLPLASGWRVVPAPHLDSMGELTLVALGWESWLQWSELGRVQPAPYWVQY